MADWITDTTVLSNFAAVIQPDLLRRATGGELLVGPEVMRELRRGEMSSRVPECDWSWLTVAVPSPAEVELARTVGSAAIDVGEAEALAIAIQRGLGVLTDDQAARRCATSRGIACSGTLGILSRLVEADVLTLDEGQVLLDRMKSLGYRAPAGSLLKP
jgi:predicted nucleic acid-binding protein